PHPPPPVAAPTCRYRPTRDPPPPPLPTAPTPPAPPARLSDRYARATRSARSTPRRGPPDEVFKHTFRVLTRHRSSAATCAPARRPRGYAPDAPSPARRGAQCHRIRGGDTRGCPR